MKYKNLNKSIICAGALVMLVALVSWAVLAAEGSPREAAGAGKARPFHVPRPNPLREMPPEFGYIPDGALPVAVTIGIDLLIFFACIDYLLGRLLGRRTGTTARDGKGGGSAAA